MSEQRQAVLGIDLGTQGVRIIAVTPDGEVLARSAVDLPLQKKELPEGWHEQNPEDWWTITCQALRSLIQKLPQGIHLAGISVDSTSGSLVVIDSNGKPLYPAILYNDNRSQKVVPTIRELCAELEENLGYAFSSSFALPKIVWFQQEFPQLFQKTAHFLSATDFIIGRLTGEYGITDFNNALKTGYDVFHLGWPQIIETGLGIPLGKLPKVISPGMYIALTDSKYCSETNLEPDIPVYAGATDGTAAQYASGAVTPGAWNTTLGTTLVLKGITENLVIDPQKRIYCHRHPEGWWMPGGASNTGCEWIGVEFPRADLNAMDRAAESYFPTPLICYPLARKGERFPFIAPDARGFLIGEAVDEPQKFAAGLEGIAMVERLSFDLLKSVGAPLVGPIIINGGSSRSTIWVKLRATILNQALIRPLYSDTCMGAAVLAASGCWYHSLDETVKHLVHMDVIVEPEKSLVEVYEEKFNCFKLSLRERNYLI
ncbi:MAG: FGGY-family carbohydrate kinase [Anaerolineaceae bacterium]